MGYLVYGAATQYPFDDRTLAHLKIAVTSKLRLQESFLLSWSVPVEQGSGRISLWLSPAIPIQFLYSASAPPALNRRWLEALAQSSHGMRGMVVMSEEEAEAIAAGDPADPATKERMRKALGQRHASIPRPTITSRTGQLGRLPRGWSSSRSPRLAEESAKPRRSSRLERATLSLCTVAVGDNPVDERTYPLPVVVLLERSP